MAEQEGNPAAIVDSMRAELVKLEADLKRLLIRRSALRKAIKADSRRVKRWQAVRAAQEAASEAVEAVAA